MTDPTGPDRERARILLHDWVQTGRVDPVAQAIADARAEGAEEGFARGYEAARANAEEDQA